MPKPKVALQVYYACSNNTLVSHRELGPLEMEVLGLFEPGEPASVADIKERLERKGSDLAYTTVMTVLSRLCTKGVLSRKRDGRRFFYTTDKRTGLVISGIVERLHRTLFKNSRMQPIASLLEEDSLSTEELRALRRLVDARIKERRK